MLDFFFSQILNFVTFLVSLLPNNQGLPDGFQVAIDSAVGYLYNFDFIFPIDTFFSLLQYILVFQFGLLLYRLTMWVIALVRGN